MKFVLTLVVLLSVIPVSAAVARDHDDDCPSIHTSCCDTPARWADRHDPRDARIAITTRDRHTTMVLTDRVVAVQLSDHTLHQLGRKLRAEMNDDDDDDGALGRAIRTAVLASVRDLLDHSIECRIRDLRDVAYRSGHLVITTVDGDRIFNDIEVDDEDVMHGFTEKDARAFVREFERVKARGR